MIQFKHSGLPKTEDDLKDSLEEIRSHISLGGKATDEVLERVERDIKTAMESVEAAKRAEKIAKDAEEMAKAAIEGSRSNGDEKILRQIRSLPQTRKVNKDEDYRGKVPQRMFNLLGQTRAELATYLDGDALGWALRVRKLNDMLMSMNDLLSIVNAGNPQAEREYAAAGGIKSLEIFPAYEECLKQGARALDTATAGGLSEWIPTLYSSDKWDTVRDRLTFASLVRWLPMPQSPWTLPTLVGFMTAYKIPESLADDNAGDTAFTASQFTTANKTLTAVKLATLSYWSRESDQDSIIAILPTFNDEIAYAQAYGVDNACMNGQLTGAVDTVAIGATDSRKLWDGYRYQAKQAAQQVDFGAGLTGELLASMIGKAGAWADLANCVFATGYAGLARALILKDSGGNLLNMTRDKAGEAATLFTGTVGVLMGYPLVVGGVYPQAMNAAGVVDGVGGSTKTGILFMSKRPYIGGHRQGLQVEASDHFKFTFDQRAVRSTQRAAMKCLQTASASVPHVIEGVNLATF